MYDWVSVVAVGMDGFCIVMDISSAYVISLCLVFVGWVGLLCTG